MLQDQSPARPWEPPRDDHPAAPPRRRREPRPLSRALYGYFEDNAKLFNAEGQEYSADSAAAIYLEDSASLFEEINPGNTLANR
jgi:hypothetical protein